MLRLNLIVLFHQWCFSRFILCLCIRQNEIVYVYLQSVNIQVLQERLLNTTFQLLILMNRKLKLWELNRPTIEEFKEKEKFPLVVVLDNIRSLANVGTFFRTADAFNVSKIILGGITAKPPHREIQKTALGATESIDWEHHENLVDLLKIYQSDGYKVYAVEQAEETEMLHELEIKTEEKHVLVFGNEVDGVQQEIIDIADVVLEIPQFGTKHSLNVSVCAGVVLWEFVRTIGK